MLKRRPALFIAGLLLATGSGFALASPAAAAGTTAGGDTSRWHCHWSHGNYWDDWELFNDDDDGWSARQAGTDSGRRWCHNRWHSYRDHGPWDGN